MATVTRMPVLIMALLALLSSLSVRAQVADMTHWPANTDTLSERIQQRVNQFDIHAASVVIFDESATHWQQTFGAAAEGSVYRMGAVVEMLTSLAVMQLVQQGHYRLDDNISDLLPQLQLTNRWQQEVPVTLHHLLQHTSGLDQRRFLNHFGNQSAITQLDAVNRDTGALHVRWQPGTMSNQSAVNYAILGALLEQHYQRSWQHVITQQVLQPLGMNSTAASLADVTADKLVPAFTGLPPEPIEHHERWLLSSEGAFSTAGDLTRLGQYWLDKSAAPGPAASLPDGDTLRAMERPHTTLASDAGLNYGVGSGVDSRARFGFWLGKTSALAGHGAILRYSPQHNIGYVILAATDAALPALEELVWQYLVRQRGSVLNIPAGLAVEQRWQGWYRLQNPPHALTAPLARLFGIAYMRRTDSELDLTPFIGPSIPLRSLDGSRLAHRQDGSVVGILHSGPAGELRVEVHGEARQQVSTLSALAPLVLVAVAFVVLLSHPFGRYDVLKKQSMRSLTTLSFVSLLLFMFAAGNISLEQATTDNWRTVLLFLFSLLFPVLAWAGMYKVVTGWRNETATVAKVRCLAGAIAACGLSVWFISAGWFGLRLWAW